MISQHDYYSAIAALYIGVFAITRMPQRGPVARDGCAVTVACDGWRFGRCRCRSVEKDEEAGARGGKSNQLIGKEKWAADRAGRPGSAMHWP